MNIKKILLPLTLTCMVGVSVTTHALDQQVIKTKDFYINRIATNSKDALNLERIITAGLAINAISLAGGTITLSGMLLGNLIISLGVLAYGPEMLATYIAVNRLDQTLKKEPELASYMTKSDTKIFNAGKAVLKGVVLNYINGQVALKNKIKTTAQQFVANHPELTTKTAQKKMVSALTSYLTWATTIKFYEETRQQQADFRKNIKAGFLTPVIQKTLDVMDSIFAQPTLKAEIKTKKKNMDQLIHKTYPALSPLVTELQTTSEKLFEQLKEIKKQYERTGKDLSKKEQPK